MQKRFWKRGVLLAIAGAAVLAAPAAAQDRQSAPAQRAAEAAVSVPCDGMADALQRATPAARLGLARAAIRQDCRPLPAPILTALRDGKWADGAELDLLDRTALTAQAAGARYAEAESLSVLALESGSWPDGMTLTVESGAYLLRGLAPALTPYRVRLVLDIYEQKAVPPVRLAALETLRRSSRLEALLPALDANIFESGPVREAGLASLLEQEEKNPADVLARVIRELPDGPLLQWAARLASQYPSGSVAAAKKRRGL